jgi:hypothetical protein
MQIKVKRGSGSLGANGSNGLKTVTAEEGLQACG